MNILQQIQPHLSDGEVVDVRIGLHWTAVVAFVDGEKRCGLASTLTPSIEQGDERTLQQAGLLTKLSAKELAQLAVKGSPLETSIGLATMNALLPRLPEKWTEENAEEVIARFGEGKRVALIGHFPFIPTLSTRVKELIVLELNPKPGDLPSSEAPNILPNADVIALTGMTIANHTFDGLISLCQGNSKIIILGPTTPLTPLLFDFGVDAICGAIVVEIDPVLRTVSEGGNFRQVHRSGVRLVNLFKD